MLVKSLKRLLLVALALGSCLSTALAQSSRGVSTFLDLHGSVPPVPHWFQCVQELKNKPFDKLKSQGCLTAILSHRQIQEGAFSLKHYKRVDELDFRLVSPSLKLIDLDMGVESDELAQLHEMLAINGDALQVGAPYDQLRQSESSLVLDQLLRSKGDRAKVTYTAQFDYQAKTARVEFKIWKGPLGEPEHLLPPYGEPCKILVGNFSWFDVDDLVPTDFVGRQMKTKWVGCFSDEDWQADLAKLKSMTFLREANISANGSRDMRSISVHLRGNPLPIAAITVQGYGLLQGLSQAEVPPLTIHPGDVYSRSATARLLQSLVNSFGAADRLVTGFSDATVNEDGKVELHLALLGYPHNVVYVDGERFADSLVDDK